MNEVLNRGCRRLLNGRSLAAVFIGVALSAGLAALGQADPDRPPMSPEYWDTVLPPNLAPIHFRIETEGSRYEVRFTGDDGQGFEVRSRSPDIRIPAAAWGRLLEGNRGNTIQLAMRVLEPAGAWREYAPVTNRIALEPIDGHLVYRLLNWQFSQYASGTIGIYQRDLSSFRERTVLRVRDRRPDSVTCINCHTLLNHEPGTMALHVRSSTEGRPMLIHREGRIETVDKPAGLLSWHPSGRLLAFSMNRFSMLLHSTGRNRDVFDSAGDIGIYWVEEQRLAGTDAIATPDHFETWPRWSADGRHLYFCRTRERSARLYREIQYDLMRISFDLDSETWGSPERVLAARDTGLSIAQPRPSPDGRYLLFCMFPYGSFPSTQPGSDLYLMDLQTREYRRLEEVNSDRAESWPCWSSNGRWFVFCSKRRDGLLMRPWISYFDEAGRAHRPFLLPQQDPTFYDSFLKIYNLPEFSRTPVTVPDRAWFQAIFSPRHPVKPGTDRVPDRPKEAPDDGGMTVRSPSYEH